MNRFLGNIFHNPESRTFVIVNNILAVITLVSVAAIVLGTVPKLHQYRAVFLIVEYTSVVFFTLEYVGRLIAVKKKRDYAFSFFGVVDLLAIVPTYIGLANLTFLKTARVLRIMRFLRMVRLTKIVRIKKNHTDIEDYSALYKLNIQLYFMALLGTVLLFGTLMYLLEAPQGTFTSIPVGMQWALETILGGSITAVYPQTRLGEIVSILARFSGLVLLGLLITVVGSTVRRLIFGTTEIVSTKPNTRQDTKRK